jgi:hypothetical protein
MVKFLKATCAICIASVCACGIAAIGAMTANLVNDVIRKCKQPFVPERVEVPRTCLIRMRRPAAEGFIAKSQEPEGQESPADLPQEAV